VQPAESAALASRLVDILSAPYDIQGHHVVIGASVGVSIAPADGSEPIQLLKNADMALYRAKADGRGTYRFFEPEMDAHAQARRALELDLRAALVRGEFEVHYQPIHDLAQGEIISLEALVRWNHPERGIMLPDDFIPLAEQTSLIIQLGEWVLRTACRDAARWPQEIKVAVNLSAVQFKSRNLVPLVMSALSASSLSPHRLELEITESVLLQDVESTLATLHQLHGLGVRISMDDFGTGYSSLGYLRSFPFDKIKIDRSFVRDVATRDDSMAIVRAVTGLGRSLGISTTAEGVETSEQLAVLRVEGCTEVQGFLFNPPRPASEIEQLLAQTARRRGVA
jgi:predicted signal transduction protein with EAL and GGDEF domain